MKVKAAVARSRGEPLRLEGLALAEPRPDEILVKMIACGVAQVDLDAINSADRKLLPFVPGSEGAGIVERVGAEVGHLAPGDAVIIGFDYCGYCPACAAGQPRACESFDAHNLSGVPNAFEGHEVRGRFFGQSSFATHVTCRASCAIKVAKGSPLEVLSCLGGEFLIGAGFVLEAVRLTKGDCFLVSGAGAVGLAAVMVARACGVATIIVVEPPERRRNLACELGADVVVHTEENLSDLVRSLAADGAQVALETTGGVDARRACLDSLAAKGTCGFVGPFGANDFSGGHSAKASRIIAADRQGAPKTLIPKLAALHARGDLPLEKLVDFFAFEHVNDALDALRSGAAAKPVLRFSIGGFGELDRAKIEGAQAGTPTGSPEPAEPTAPVEPSLARS